MDVAYRPCYNIKPRLRLDPYCGLAGVPFAVILTSGGPDRRALRLIQHPEVNTGAGRRSCPFHRPRASTSLTRCPLAVPPIAGLQDIRPMAMGSMVTRAVEQPIRAAASEASIPACPPPTTMTSYLSLLGIGCFTWNSLYFPTQNRAKMWFSISSVVTSPVMLESARVHSLTSKATNSFVDPARSEARAESRF